MAHYRIPRIYRLRRFTSRKIVLSALLAALLSSATGVAFAMDPSTLPTAGNITAGSGSISQQSNVLTVNQASQSLIVNWGSFNIGSSATVNFNQPSSSAVALNRVNSSDASQIYGHLNANGNVFLVNPMGVVFGKGAQVNVGGMVASTLDIADQDFLKGTYRFSNGGHAGSVVNQGSIIAAPGGYAALIGPNVRNDGLISAQLGTVALAGGNRVTLDPEGDGLVKVAVDQGAVNALADNHGLLQADGGRVIMTAKSANDLLSTVVNNDGVIQAHSLTHRGGQVWLEASDPVANSGQTGAQNHLGKVQNAAGAVASSGTIDVSAAEAGAGQGEVTLAGSQVNLAGAIRAQGGDGSQGARVLLDSTNNTTVAATAAIDASGHGNGSAGNVVVWSDKDTAFTGSITARGGEAGGNGGQVEVSGHDNLAFAGSVDTRATSGQSGSLLLDPATLEITDTPAGSGDQDATVTSGNGTLSSTATDTVANTISRGTLETLAASNNINLSATGQITIDAMASHLIDLTGGQTTGGHSVTLTSMSSGGIKFNDATTELRTAGGNITLRANNSGALSNLGLLTSNGGAINLNTQSGTIGTIGAINAGGGAINLITTGGAINNAGALTTAGAGTINLNSNSGNLTNSAAISARDGGVTLVTSGTLTNSGAIATNNGAITLETTGANALQNNSGGKLQSAGGAIKLWAAGGGSLTNADSINDATGAVTLQAVSNGTLTNSGNITDGGAMLLTTFNGTLTNNNALTASGTGTVTLQTTGAGNLNNTASASIVSAGGLVALTTFNGTITNNSSITSNGAGGIALKAIGSVGTLTNTGAINGGASNILLEVDGQNGLSNTYTNGTQSALLSTTTGNITLKAGTVGGAINNSGAISVSSGGNVLLQNNYTIANNGNGNLTNSGAISDTGGTITEQTAGGALNDSGNLTTQGQAVNLTTSAGNMTHSGSITSNNGAVNFTSSSGSITVNGTVNAGSGVATVTANGNSILTSVSSGNIMTAGAVSLTAHNGQYGKGSIGASGKAVSVATGQLTLSADGDLYVTDADALSNLNITANNAGYTNSYAINASGASALNMSFGGQYLDVNTAGQLGYNLALGGNNNLNVSNLLDAGYNVSLTAPGSITGRADATHLTAGTLTLSAPSIGSSSDATTPLYMTVGTLNANSNISNLNVSNAGTLTLGTIQVGSSATIAAVNGNLVADSNGDKVTGPSVTLKTRGGDIGASSNAPVVTSTSSLAIDTDQNAWVTNDKNFSDLSITLQHGSGITANTLAVNASNLANGTTFNIQDTGSQYNILNIAPTAQMNFAFTGAQDVQVGPVNTAGGSISITSTTGNIRHDGGASQSSSRLVGSSVVLKAAGSIGTSTDAVLTSTPSLDVTTGLNLYAEDDQVLSKLGFTSTEAAGGTAPVYSLTNQHGATPAANVPDLTWDVTDNGTTTSINSIASDASQPLDLSFTTVHGQSITNINTTASGSVTLHNTDANNIVYAGTPSSPFITAGTVTLTTDNGGSIGLNGNAPQALILSGTKNLTINASGDFNVNGLDTHIDNLAVNLTHPNANTTQTYVLNSLNGSQFNTSTFNVTDDVTANSQYKIINIADTSGVNVLLSTDQTMDVSTINLGNNSGSTPGNLTLHAKAGNINAHVDGFGAEVNSITAANFTATADAGSIGSSSDALNTFINTYDNAGGLYGGAGTSGRGTFLNQSGALTIGTATAGSDSVIVSNGGDINLGSINMTGHRLDVTTNASIASGNITGAGEMHLTATNNIGSDSSGAAGSTIQTSSGSTTSWSTGQPVTTYGQASLYASASGDVKLHESGKMEVKSVTAATNATTPAGRNWAMDLQAGQDLIIDSLAGNISDVTLSSGLSSTFNAITTTGNFHATAGTAMTFNAGGLNAAGTIYGSAGSTLTVAGNGATGAGQGIIGGDNSVTLSAGRDMTINDTGLSTTGGGVSATAGGNLAVTNLNTVSGNISLTGGSSYNFTLNGVATTGSITGSGGAVSASNLSAGAGGISLTSQNALTVGSSTTSGAAVIHSNYGDANVNGLTLTGTGGATLYGGNNLYINSNGLTTASGDIKADSPDSITIAGLTTTSGNVTANAGWNMNVTSLQGGSGNVIVNGGQSASLNGLTTTGSVSSTASSFGVTATSVTAGTSITLSAGQGISVGSIDSTGAGAVKLTANSGSITGGSGNSIIGGALTLNASSGSVNGGNIGTPGGQALNVQSTSISASAINGGINILQSGSNANLTLTTYGSSSSDRDISVAATSGDLTLGAITAGYGAANISLSSSAGHIYDDELLLQQNTWVTGNDITLSAATGIGTPTTNIDIRGKTLTATTTSGAVNIGQGSQALTVNSITTGNGPISLSSAGALTLNSSVTGAGANDVSVTTSSGSITLASNATVSSGSGNVTLKAGAGGNLALGSGNAVTTNGGDITVGAGGNLTMTSGNTFSTGGSIALSSGGNLALTRAAAGGSVTVTAGGSITNATGQSGAGNENLSGTSISITAGGGIGTGTTAVSTNTGHLTANSTGTGDVDLANTGGVSLDGLTAHSGSINVTTGGDTTLVSAVSGTDAAGHNISVTDLSGNITVGTVSGGNNGNVTLKASAGGILDDEAGMAQTTWITGNSVALNAASGIGTATTNIDVNASHLTANTSSGPVTIGQGSKALSVDGLTGTGPIDLAAAGPLTLNTSVAASGANGVAVTTSGGDLTMNAGTSITSGSGDITVSAGGNLKLTRVSTGGGITATATNGAITNASGLSGSGQENLAGSSVDLTAGAGIGTNGTPVSTDASTLNAVVTGTGGINIANTGGADLHFLSAHDGAITVTTGGNTTVTNAVSGTDAAGNDINVTASSGDLTLGTITAGATHGQVTLASTGGHILDDEAGLGNSTVVAGNGISLTAAQGIGAPGTNIDVNGSRLSATVTGTDAVSGRGEIDIDQTGGGQLYASNLSTYDGDIHLTAPGDLVVQSATANTGNLNHGDAISLTSAGGDLKASTVKTDGNVNLSAADGYIYSGTGATGVTSDIRGATVTLASGNGMGGVGATSQLNITATDHVDASATNGTPPAGGTYGNIYLNLPSGGTLGTLTAANGSINVTGGGALTLNDSLAGNGSNGVSVTTTSGNVNLGSNVSVSSGAGDVTVSAGTGGDLLMAAGNSITTGGGNITVGAGNNLALTRVATTGSGTITATATNGAITGVGGSGTAGSENLAAHSISMTAGDGIGSNGTPLPLYTAASTIDAAVTGAGNINLANTGGANLDSLSAQNGAITVTTGGATAVTSVTSATDATGNDISITAHSGDLTLGRINAGNNGNVNLISTTGAILDDEPGLGANTVVAGNMISMTAANGIGTASTNVDTNASTLHLAMTGTGPVNIHQGARAVTLDPATFTGGDFTLNADGNVGVDRVSTDGNISINAAGAITNASGLGGAGHENLAGSSVILNAATGIGNDGNGALSTAANTLDLSASNGDVKLTNTGGATITEARTGAGSVDVTTGGNTTVTHAGTDGGTGHDVTITASTGDLTLGSIDAGNSGNVTLAASNGQLQDDGVPGTAVTGNAVKMTAANGIGTSGNAGIDTNASSLDLTVTGTGGVNVNQGSKAVRLSNVSTHDGAIGINASGDVIASQVSNGGNQAINITSGGTITAGSIGADGNTGDVTLTASNGQIKDDEDGDGHHATVLTGNHLTLTAHAGIGANGDVDISGNRLTAISDSGPVDIYQAGGPLTVDAIATTVGPVTLAAAGSLALAGDITSTGTGDVTVTTSAGDITGGAGTRIGSDSGNVTINAADNASLNDVGTSGNISAIAGNNLTLNGGITSTGGTVAVTATQGALSMGDGSSLTSNAGNLTLSSGSDTTLTRVATAGDINVTAGGQVTNALGNDTSGTGHENLSGGTVSVHAGTGVGTAADALATDADTLNLAVTGSGSINVQQSKTVTVGTVSAADGDVAVQALAGDLNLGAGQDAATPGVVSGKTVTLTAHDSILTVNQASIINAMDGAFLTATGGTIGTKLTAVNVNSPQVTVIANGKVGDTSASINGQVGDHQLHVPKGMPGYGWLNGKLAYDPCNEQCQVAKYHVITTPPLVLDRVGSVGNLPPISIQAVSYGIQLPAGVSDVANWQDTHFGTASPAIMGGNDTELGRQLGATAGPIAVPVGGQSPYGQGGWSVPALSSGPANGQDRQQGE